MRYPRHADYRESGIDWLGAIPCRWNLKRGRFCARLSPPVRSLTRLSMQDEVSFVPMEAVGEWGGMSLESTKPIEDIGSGYSVFQDGDVIVAKITPCFENGKGALACGLMNGVAFGTTELHVLRAASELEARFLFYLTISSVFRSLGEAHMYGAGGQKRVPGDFVRDFPFPLPSLQEQRGIAEFLDERTATIATLIAKKQALIERLREKRQALISLVVTRGLPPDAARAAGLEPQPKLKPSSVEWLGTVPAHWNVRRIKYAARIESGHTPSRSVEEYWVNCTIPWVSLNDSSHLRAQDYITETSHSISELGVANSSARILPASAVVFSRDATVGLCAITTRPMAVSQHFIAYVCGPELLPEYLLYSLQAMAQHLERLSLGATIATIGMDDVRSLSCAVPPFTEQQAICRYIQFQTGKIDRLLATIELAVQKLGEYRSALITAAVTGKIDVRKAMAAA